MDTRAKIIDFAALPQKSLCIVNAYFDPLLAWHAERLADIRHEGETLVGAVLPLKDELLPQRARAEMVAALRVIDYVLICSTPIAPEGARVVSLAEEDLVRRAAMVDDVRNRPSR